MQKLLSLIVHRLPDRRTAEGALVPGSKVRRHHLLHGFAAEKRAAWSLLGKERDRIPGFQSSKSGSTASTAATFRGIPAPAPSVPAQPESIGTRRKSGTATTAGEMFTKSPQSGARSPLVFELQSRQYALARGVRDASEDLFSDVRGFDMHLDQFRQAMSVANLAAGLTALAGVAASIHFGAVIVGILFTLAFAFTLHGIVYTALCHWRIPDARSRITAPRFDDGPNGTGMIICSRPTGDMDLDFYLDTYASMRHGYGARQIFSALRPTLFALLVTCVVMAL